MREQWRPKPPPPPSRIGALAFVFVLVLCALLTGLLFVLNPLAPAARLGALLGVPEATTTGVSLEHTHSTGQPWLIYLPLVQR